jgi:putative Holliday junction resolvase
LSGSPFHVSVLDLSLSRFLGVDYGERRIGLALSDPTGTIASPAGTLSRRAGKRPPWAEIERIVREKEVVGIVVGLPLNLEGAETPWSAEIREFAEKLQARTGLSVHLIDERLTSVMAERAVRGSGLRKSSREQKERIDETAAAIILQNFLERARTRHG